MGTIENPVLFVGMQETFSKVITDGEIALFAGLIGNNAPQMIDAITQPVKTAPVSFVPQFLMTGIISGILHSRFPGGSAQCVNIHFEFLAPVHTGEQIVTTIEVTRYEPQKHLAAFKVDCYDQNKNQIITGQAVMLVPT